MLFCRVSKLQIDCGRAIIDLLVDAKGVFAPVNADAMLEKCPDRSDRC